MIGRVVIEEMARGFDWAIVRDGPLEREFRHWSHWRPSSALRLTIAPRVVRAAVAAAPLPAERSGA
jgi:hypothetical protein